MTNAPALKQRTMPGSGPLCAVFLPPESLISRRSRQLPPGEAMDGQAKAELEMYQQKEPEKYEQLVKQMISGELMSGGNPNDMQNMQPAPNGGQQPV